MIFLFFGNFCFSQVHPLAGVYIGTAKVDSFLYLKSAARVEIVFELKADSTYFIQSKLILEAPRDSSKLNQQIYHNGLKVWTKELLLERDAFEGQWLSIGEFIFLKPCNHLYNSEHVNNPGYSFGNDLCLGTYHFLEELKIKKKVKKQIADAEKLGFKYFSRINKISKEIFFHYSNDGWEEVWVNSPVKRIN
ncbi:MAG: hypothetical protein V4622_05200 [Bacteroidota bacterium]